jgi:hypothetical protein
MECARLEMPDSDRRPTRPTPQDRDAASTAVIPLRTTGATPCHVLYDGRFTVYRVIQPLTPI